jgi:glutathione synthase
MSPRSTSPAGDYVTEINVTSPTCIRELDAQFGLDIGGRLMDLIASRLP